jgi:uncharacterized protein YjaG (DUF416 family)
MHTTLNFETFLPQLARDLGNMSARHRVAFSAACCERAVANFESYAKDTNVADSGAVRRALDEIWLFISHRRAVLDVVVLREACEAQLPPTRDNHALASAAAESIQMLDLLLQQVTDPQAELSLRIAGWAQASIDGYLQMGSLRVSALDALESADLMQRELSRQAADLEWLKNQRTLDSSALGFLRSRAAADGASLAGARLFPQ